MSSTKQIKANRLNALKSTGPVTAAGKAISSRNAVAPNGAAMRLQIMEAFHTRFAPVSLEERFSVDVMAHAEYRQRNLQRAENSIWKYHEIEGGTAEDNSLAAVYCRASLDLDRVGRAIDRTAKLFDAAHSFVIKNRAIRLPQTSQKSHSGLFCVPNPTAS